MKYTHYSPNADLIVVKGTDWEIKEKLLEVLHAKASENIGIMVSQEMCRLLDIRFSTNVKLKILGSRKNIEEITANLFDALRWFDRQDVSIIYAESFPEDNIGAALMNRLYKAAGGKVI